MKHAIALVACLVPAFAQTFEVAETADRIRIVSPALEAAIQKKGYVSGVAGGSFVDRKTGFRDAGFGLDIVDWIMEPGSDEAYRDKLDKDLVYEYGNLYHGNIPKRGIEGPQICTKARELEPQVIRGKDFVAVRSRFQYRIAAPGKKTGSVWEQTLVFPAGKRYFLSSDKITSVNASPAMFLRVDMPGHIKHTGGDTFSEVYLSYHGRIPASEFRENFPPDAKFRYTRGSGAAPKRLIRAYHLRDPKTGRPGPWLAGMTLDPSVVSDAWCHQRGYVCMIEEFGGRRIRPGDSFSAAFLVGFFDSIPEMERIYDEYAGSTGIEAREDGWRLTGKTPEWLTRRLEWFRDQKFGFFMHWGAYSQMGVIESWPLSWADRSWGNPSIQTREQMQAFRDRYFALPKTFNPVKFDPKPWAELTRRAGMRYVVFTTKHHDGFNMYDTRLTDYRITAPDVPFSRDPRADVAKVIFDAFRSAGFAVGAYYSKADWHSPYYWKPGVFAEDRNPNYDTAAEPTTWAKFVDFVHGQIEELMTRYGKIDMLWLDAGQVRPPKQDIQMDRLVAMARRHQPGLIVVDRTAGTEHENYRTPEQEVPDKPLLDYPWESCITMGKQWSFKPNDEYKSARELIHLLAGVVAKGGNLLLNVGPQPDGQLPAEAVSRLREIGDWMEVNAEAIHGTRPVAPYAEGRVAFTRKGSAVYAIYLAPESETRPPAVIRLAGFRPRAGARIELLGSKTAVKWAPDGAGIAIHTSGNAAVAGRYAFVYRLSGALQ